MDQSIKEVIKTSYNQNARHRDRSDIVKWKQKELERFIESFEDFRGVKILDMGAGSGIYGKYFSDLGGCVKCIDLSEAMIDLCKSKELDAEVMDFYELTFESNTFDAIWSMNTLLHVPKKSLPIVLKGIQRVLKKDGMFYLGIYGGKSSEGIYEGDFYEPKRFFALYDNAEIKKILEEYFSVESFDVIEMEEEALNFQSIMLKNDLV